MSRPRYRRYFRHGFLPQVIAFEACVRLGSVTRAAEELSLAQPTVSGLLRRLSETVGEPLLESRNGRMEPTEAGRNMARLCDEILDSLGRFDATRIGRRKPDQGGAPLPAYL
jgi:DNA-binding transcriptional LysR family regulator